MFILIFCEFKLFFAKINNIISVFGDEIVWFCEFSDIGHEFA